MSVTAIRSRGHRMFLLHEKRGSFIRKTSEPSTEVPRSFLPVATALCHFSTPVEKVSPSRNGSFVLCALYHGFAGFVPSGRADVSPECVHKPWESGKQYYQTAMVCVTDYSQTMEVWKTVLPNSSLAVREPGGSLT